MDTSHQSAPANTSKKPSPEEWEDIWARKFRKNLYALKKTGNSYTPVIREMVRSFPGYPGNIKPEQLSDFISAAKDRDRQRYTEALTVFFTETIPSEKHLALLRSIADRKDRDRKKISSSGSTDIWLNKIEEHCIGRNILLREREEIKHITAGFLRFYKMPPAEIPLQKIESSLLKFSAFIKCLRLKYRCKKSNRLF
jgi:hypothetical protein